MSITRKLTKADQDLKLNALLLGVESDFRDRFLEIVAILQSSEALTALELLLAQGKFGEALAAAEEAAAALAPKYGSAFVLAGNEAADWASGKLKLAIDFDAVNEDAVRAIRENNLRLVREVTDQTRNALREILVRAQIEGTNPVEVAREIRGSIGLTEYQVKVVDNYRRLLEEGDSGALARKLRDARFDPTVRRAIREKSQLTKDQIDRMVSRYRERMLALRAETIARTEALASVHAGTEAMFQQLIDSGVITADQVIRGIVVGHPPRTRDWHASMRNQKRGWKEPFRSGHGVAIIVPGDPSLPADERINCRCTVTYRLKPLAENVAGG